MYNRVESADSKNPEGWKTMKLKKVLAVLFACVMVLTMSSSVFAADVQPQAAGIGDTKDSAISLLSMSQDHTLYLSNAQDQDWFKWTNNTGAGKLVSAFVMPSGNQCIFRVGMQIKYADGKESSVFYGTTPNPGSGTHLYRVYVPEGATAYIVIDSTYYAMEQYQFLFRAE
ncbi:hypothetical protein DMN77_05380 [Paenibacillus sp. 79R4]|nr:hypothetical protein [Paenibacillus sp. 79R4]